MPSDPKRSVLSELKRPLMQPVPSAVPPAIEQKFLGTEPAAPTMDEPAPIEAEPAPPTEARPSGGRQAKGRVPTVPVTFHLPIELRDRIKVTAQAKQKTMLEIAVDALQQYLAQNPVSEADLRRMLGL